MRGQDYNNNPMAIGLINKLYINMTRMAISYNRFLASWRSRRLFRAIVGLEHYLTTHLQWKQSEPPHPYRHPLPMYPIDHC
jgi:hypothetical protein